MASLSKSIDINNVYCDYMLKHLPIVKQYSDLQQINIQFVIQSMTNILENNFCVVHNGLSANNKQLLFEHSMFDSFQKINKTHSLFVEMLNNNTTNHKELGHINSMFPKILHKLKEVLHTELNIPCDLIDKYIEPILHDFMQSMDIHPIDVVNIDNTNDDEEHEEQQKLINDNTTIKELITLISDEEDEENDNINLAKKVSIEEQIRNDEKFSEILFDKEQRKLEKKLKKQQQLKEANELKKMKQIEEDEIIAKNINSGNTYVHESEINDETLQENDSYKIVNAFRAVKGWIV